jgi:hypothetical protein
MTSEEVDIPTISDDVQPMKVTTIPSHCGGRLRRTSVLKVWMPIATMKKNDPNCPIIFNDPRGTGIRTSERAWDGRGIP